ncbi:MAG: hypothetical protein ACLQK4_00105 [Acidimicrobiales bacterium]|jgi:hypothetical protein
MKEDRSTSPVDERDGFLVGPTRTPRNRASATALARTGMAPRAHNIHDDDTAKALGFRGGTIAGSIHLDQFPPVVLAAFADRWFEDGSISLLFRNATVDAEPVIAMVAKPAPGADLLAARMERTDGLLVAEGTVSVGREAGPTYLSALDLRPADPGELRLLEGVVPGAPISGRSFTVDGDQQRERLEAAPITEPLAWYMGASPWGPPIVNPSAIVQLIRNGPADFGSNVAEAVGLFGAIELRFFSGPLRCDTPYSVAGEIVAVGASPKTEYVWYDSRAIDEAGEVAVAMRMQLRWMKASSPLYAPQD